MKKAFRPSSIHKASFSHEIEMPGGTSFAVRNMYFDNTDLVRNRSESIVLFPGFAEQDTVARKSLVLLAQLGVRAVAPVVEFDQIPESIKRGSNRMADAVWAVASQTPGNVAEFMHEVHGVDGPIKAIGNSSGAGILGIGLHMQARDVESYGDIALLEPVGLTNKAGQVCASTPALMRRFVRGAVLVTPPWRSGIGSATHDFIKEAWHERRSLAQQFELANTASVVTAIARHSDEHAVSIFSGTRDTIFPLGDIIDNLNRRDVPYHHASLSAGELNLSQQLRPSQPGISVYALEGTRHENLSYPRGQRMLRLGAQALGVAA